MNDSSQTQYTKHVGRDLIDYSKSIPTSTRGMVTELFPYIYEASTRMSSRAIAYYLNDNHKVGISASTVARALRRPEQYFDAYLDELEPALQTIKQALGPKCDVQELLVDEEQFFQAFNEEPLSGTLEPPEDLIALAEYKDAVAFIKDKWWSCGDKFRDYAYRRLRRRETEEYDKELEEPEEEEIP